MSYLGWYLQMYIKLSKVSELKHLRCVYCILIMPQMKMKSNMKKEKCEGRKLKIFTFHNRNNR